MAWMKKSNDGNVEHLHHPDENFPEPQENIGNLDNAQQDKQNDFVQLGQLLASARKKKNLTKKQVIEKLKIKEKNLDAIEKGDVMALNMPRPFLRGFLREYCELLGAGNLWREYDRITAVSTNKASINSDIAVESRDSHEYYSVTIARKKSLTLITLFLSVVILLILYFVFQLRRDIVSQGVSPIEIVMGLNPLNKIESDDNKDLVGNDSKANLESEDVDGSTSEVDSQVPHEDRAQLSEENTASVADEARNIDKKLPTDATSFGWLDSDKQAVGSKEQASQQTVAEKPPLTPKDKRTITVKAVNVLWIRVSTQNRRIFQGLMQKGEVRNFVVESVPVTIRYGKGNKALVTWNGVENLVSNLAKPITVKYTLEEQ